MTERVLMLSSRSPSPSSPPPSQHVPKRRVKGTTNRHMCHKPERTETKRVDNESIVMLEKDADNCKVGDTTIPAEDLSIKISSSNAVVDHVDDVHYIEKMPKPFRHRSMSVGDKPRNLEEICRPHKETAPLMETPTSANVGQVEVTQNCNNETKPSKSASDVTKSIEAKKQSPCDVVCELAKKPSDNVDGNSACNITSDDKTKKFIHKSTNEIKKKNHHHHRHNRQHHHHRRRRHHSSELSKEKDLGKKKPKESSEREALNKFQKKSSSFHSKNTNHQSTSKSKSTAPTVVNGNLTSSSAMAKISTTPKSATISSMLSKMKDKKLRNCKCVVRIERLHPDVAKRLARYGYVRMRSRQKVQQDDVSPATEQRPILPVLASTSASDMLYKKSSEIEQKILKRKAKRREKIKNLSLITKIGESDCIQSPTIESSPEEGKWRRIVRVVDSSDDDNKLKSPVPSLHEEESLEIPAITVDDVESSTLDILAPLFTPSPPAAEFEENGILVVDAAQDTLQGDNSIMSNSDGPDVSMVSLANDDDALLQEPQVDQSPDFIAPIDNEDLPVVPEASLDSSKVIGDTSKSSDVQDECFTDDLTGNNLNECEKKLDDEVVLGEHQEPDIMKVSEKENDSISDQGNSKADQSSNQSAAPVVVNGISKLASSSTKTKISPSLNRDKMSPSKLKDYKLKRRKCVVRIKRLRPVVLKILAKRGYVKTGTKHKVRPAVSSAPSIAEHRLKQPISSSSSTSTSTVFMHEKNRKDKLKQTEKIRELVKSRTSVTEITKADHKRSVTSELTKVKRRRIVEVVDSSDDDGRPSSPVPQVSVEKPLEIPAITVTVHHPQSSVSNLPTPMEASPQSATELEENVILPDVYNSFDVDVVKDTLQVDDFLMSGSNGLDVSMASFAGDVDVLIQARQVGQSTDAVAALDDNYWPLETKSSWETTKQIVCASNSNSSDGKLIADFAEDNLNEYERYLDDCDFLGEVSPGRKNSFEKGRDSVIPDQQIYSKSIEPRNQGMEELQLQINGAINISYLNHSPVKLSPHTVMLSSSVCEVPSSKDVDIIAAESSNDITKTSLIPACHSLDSPKSNMAAAPFAMTTDLDVTANVVAAAPEDSTTAAEFLSPASVQVQANSDHTYNSGILIESITPKELVSISRFGQMPQNENVIVSVGSKSSQNVWKFGRPPPSPPKLEMTLQEGGSVKTIQNLKKIKTDSTVSANRIKRSPIRQISLADRIAKVLGAPAVEAAAVVVSDNNDNDRDGFLLTNRAMSASPKRCRARKLRNAVDLNDANSKKEVVQSFSSQQLESFSNAELRELFQHEISNGNLLSALNIFNVLRVNVNDSSSRYSMLTSVLQMANVSQVPLTAELVGPLFTAVVELSPLFACRPIHQQIRILIAIFSTINKCERRLPAAASPALLHNFTRTVGPKYGSDLIKPPSNISEIYNEVLRVAIDADVSELPLLHRLATDVGIDIDESNLRSLLIMFHSNNVGTLAKELFRMGCSMGVYPRVRIREWPHLIKIKSHFADGEIEVIIRDYLVKMANKLKMDANFYECRSLTEDEALTVYISIEELPRPDGSSSATKVLSAIDSTLQAVNSRLINIFVNLLDKTFLQNVIQRDKGRIMVIGPTATLHLLSNEFLRLEMNEIPKYSSEDNQLKLLSPKT